MTTIYVIDDSIPTTNTEAAAEAARDENRKVTATTWGGL